MGETATEGEFMKKRITPKWGAREQIRFREWLDKDNNREMFFAKKREWRKKNLARTKERVNELKRARHNSKAGMANKLIKNMVLRGALVRPTVCYKCDSSVKISAHHPDYDKPFDIVWLCHRCHMKEHRKYKEPSDGL